MFSSHAVSGWTRSPGGCGFRGAFRVWRIFFSILFFLRTPTACCKHEATLPNFLSTSTEARPRERSDRGHFLPLRVKSFFIMRPFFAYIRKSLFIPGYVQGAIMSLVYVSVSVCVTFVVFTHCESCSGPMFTNPGSMEAGECGLTRGTCFAVRRLELVAVAGRL